MKSLKNKLIVVSVVCVVVITAAVWLMPPLGNDKKPRWGRALTIGNFLNVHEGSIPWLEIGGEKYTDVAGYEPYYLDLPQKNAYFFVTSDPTSHSNTAHFAFMESGRFYDISTGDSSIGDGIGRKKTDWECDEVYDYHWPIVVIRKRFDKYINFYEFDLIKGTCRKK